MDDVTMDSTVALTTPPGNSVDDFGSAFKAVPMPVMIICMCIWAFEVCAGLLANVSVIYMLTRTSMGSTKTIPLLNLAISDAVWLACLPLCVIGFQLKVTILIKIVFSVMWITRPVLIWNLVFIAAQRYVLIVHRESRVAEYILRRNVVIALSVAVWVLTNVVSVALSVTEEFKMRTSHSFASTLTYFLLEFLIPLFLISICYALIGRYVCKSMKSMSGHVDDDERYSRTLKVLGVLVCAFIVAWLPWNICLLIVTSHPQRHVTPALMVTATFGLTLIFGNSALNPYLYCYVADDFKRQFRQTMCCGRCRTEQDVEEEQVSRQTHSSIATDAPMYGGAKQPEELPAKGAKLSNDI